MTAFIFGGFFFTGYIYARLEHDEVLRRRCYAKYANFISLFDHYSDIYDRNYLALQKYLATYDSSYSWWYFKQIKKAEFKAKKSLQKEIYEKEMEDGDDLSKALMAFDRLGDGTK